MPNLLRSAFIVLSFLLVGPASAAFNSFQASQTGSGSGWTVFTPTSGTGSCSAGTYTGSCEIKVAVAGNDGTCAPTAPPFDDTDTLACATIGKGLTLLRNGKPDWLVLKKGDTFTASIAFPADAGPSAGSPILFSAYGSLTARPIIKSPSNTDGFSVSDPSFHFDNLAVVGINFYASTRDPNSGDYAGTAGNNGFAMAANGSNIIIEDNVFQFYVDDIAIDATGFVLSNVTLNRNVIVDAYSATSLSIGTFLANISTVTLTENLFDHNGWNSTLIAAQTCSITIAAPAVATCAGLIPLKMPNNAGIVFSGTLPTGLSTNTLYCATNLSGGDVFNIALPSGSCATPGSNITTTGSAGSPSVQWADAAGTIFNRNLYIHCQTLPVTATGNISANSAAEGAEFRTAGTITDNLFVQDIYVEVGHLEGCPVRTVANVSKNVILNSVDIPGLPTTGFGRGEGIVGFSLNTSGVQITNNIIAHVSSVAGTVAGLNLDSTVTNIVATNNIICDWANPITDSGTGNTTTPNQTKASDCNAGGWTGSQPSLVAPNRTIGGYYASIGNPGGFGSTTAGFISAARLQSKANWNNALTADLGVNPYIRAGFGL